MGARVDSPRFLIRDRDAKYTKPFDAVFTADGTEVVKTAPRAPRMNAHCERVIATLRREALDHLLIWNETHARHILDAYARHYNRHRPHQARGQRPPLAHKHPAPVTNLTAHRLLRTRVLGRRHQRVEICSLTSSDEFPNGTGFRCPSIAKPVDVGEPLPTRLTRLRGAQTKAPGRKTSSQLSSSWQRD